MARKGAGAIKNQIKTMPRSKGTAKGVKGTEGPGKAGRPVGPKGGIAMKAGKYGSSNFTQRMEKKDGAV